MDPQTPVLVVGGAGFSYQLHPKPETLPVAQILRRAFDVGLRAIDTSPYYEPSEEVLGAALAHDDITSRYAREDLVLMTKVGRLGEHVFDYSPDSVRASVSRSLQRLRTTYLDVVFCHDVEFVSVDAAVAAVGVLLKLQSAGVVLRVGISGRDMDRLVLVATRVRTFYGRPLDAVQTWAHLTLQSTQAEQWGFAAFAAAGISTVYCSSPLAIGLLRNGGVPKGRTGDWHPAPAGLRAASQQAAEWLAQEVTDNDTLASVALRYTLAKARQNCRPGFSVAVITGISSMSDLEENVATAKRILHAPCGGPSALLQQFTELDQAALLSDQPLYEHIRTILGPWIDYDFTQDVSKQANTESNGGKDTIPHSLARINLKAAALGHPCESTCAHTIVK